jgi:SecY interacting protein Syd
VNSPTPKQDQAIAKQDPPTTSVLDESNTAESAQSSIEVLSEFTQAFDNLVANYIKTANTDNKGLLTYFEQDWPSPCVELFNDNSAGLQQDALVNWQPVLRHACASSKVNEESQSTAQLTNLSDASINLSNLEKALEITLPVQAHALFCRYFSHDINASAEQGGLTLIQAWNEEDFDRLQKNLISHVLMKRRLKQADTLFFALTDEEDLLLSILLETGEIVLEVVGKEPHQLISPNLTTFMASLTPRPVLVSL